ncbi:MAG: 2-oxo acid dehydrogenase subunit E2 [Acidobacteria bacterium]|nr:2-oxo acid dehydrogenase subunit E2 [Acidobacteriota bacterium]
MKNFTVPELGENVPGGDVTRVLVSVGDTIALEQTVLELETDKATIEVPSSVAGKVSHIVVSEGDKVVVGAVILTVEETDAGADAPAEATEEDTEDAPAAAPEAAPVEAAAVAATEPDRPVAAKGRPSGKVVSMPARDDAASSTKVSARKQAPGGAPSAPASPSVRRLAREVGVNIDQVQGSGPNGRISEDDVKEYARRLVTGAAARGGTSGRPTAPLPNFEKWGEVDRQPMSNIRRTTADRLGHAWNVVPHVTQCDKADITAMEELRRKYRAQVHDAGGNLTVTAMLVKVLATAVKQFPQFNASLDAETEEIVYKKYVNVGVAVDTDRGLLVPVIRNADQKNITEIAIEVNLAAERARSRKLTLEEMSGGGITISNLGGIGGTYFTPIVNWPEVAILGVSRGIIEPVWRDDAFEPRQLLPLSLSYDHRVVDGADAVHFLRWVVEAIEQPFLLSLLS